MIKTKRFLMITVMLLALPAAAFEIKGITIGAPATKEQVLAAFGASCGEGAADMLVCNGATTLAGENVTLNLVIDAHGVVQRMDFDFSPGSFDVIAIALAEKFGRPSARSTPVLRNVFGASFKQDIRTWRGKNGVRMELHRYTSRIDHGQLYLSTPADRRLLEEVSRPLQSDL